MSGPERPGGPSSGPAPSSAPERPGLVDAYGAPIGRAAGASRPPCPRCGAGPEKRIPSAGFGRAIHDVCQTCGHEFEERTV